MSGIYIKGIKLPTEGYIDLRIKCNGIASFPIADNPYFKAVEAIPVPDHGDLIDREWMREAFYRYAKTGGTLYDLADEAPTIIPAEEDE